MLLFCDTVKVFTGILKYNYQANNYGVKEMDIAAYYFPNYHADAKNEEVHGRNWTEWELMKCARSRFEGHQQPKVPVWGYEDEADPAVMAKKIILDREGFEKEQKVEQERIRGLYNKGIAGRSEIAGQAVNDGTRHIRPDRASGTKS